MGLSLQMAVIRLLGDPLATTGRIGVEGIDKDDYNDHL